jgi:hypothetical protein
MFPSSMVGERAGISTLTGAAPRGKREHINTSQITSSNTCSSINRRDMFTLVYITRILLNINALIGLCNTIYTQTYVDTPSNEWIWQFQPHPLLTDIYKNKIKQTAMQSPKTNICSRMALLKSLVTFNEAPSWDATFPTSQYVTFRTC